MGAGLISTKQNFRAGRSRPEVAVPLLGRSPSRKRLSSPPREERFVGAFKVEDVRVIGHGEITIDSGAAESVWPVGFMDNILTKPADKDKSNNLYVAANGSRMRNMSMKEVQFRSGKSGGHWNDGLSGHKCPKPASQCQAYC